MVCEEADLSAIYTEPRTFGYEEYLTLALDTGRQRGVDYEGGRRLHTWARELRDRRSGSLPAALRRRPSQRVLELDVRRGGKKPRRRRSDRRGRTGPPRGRNAVSRPGAGHPGGACAHPSTHCTKASVDLEVAFATTHGTASFDAKYLSMFAGLRATQHPNGADAPGIGAVAGLERAAHAARR